MISIELIKLVESSRESLHQCMNECNIIPVPHASTSSDTRHTILSQSDPFMSLLVRVSAARKTQAKTIDPSMIFDA
jgi:hypothetical protein